MEFKCEFQISGSSYDCNVTSAVIDKPNTKIVAFKGIHQPGKADKDVSQVQFSGLGLEYFPRGLHSIFPQLTGLFINITGLKTISQKDLIGLENLDALYITNSQLKSLPNNLFTNMGKLQQVSFQGNKLEFISSEVLKPLLPNKPIFINFLKNTSIDDNYYISQENGIAHFMTLIDKKCSKPIEEPEEDKTVSCEWEFSEGFKDLWASGRFSDFTFAVGSKEFHLHKFVIGTQSPVFAEIFENDMQGRNEIELKIEESKSDAVEDFLRYFYTGQIPDEIDALEVFALASKFKVQRLKMECERKVLKKVDEKNALEVFLLGQLHGSIALKCKALDEIRKMFPEFELEADLIDKPVELKALLEAKQERDRTIEAAGKVFAEKTQQFKKK